MKRVSQILGNRLGLFSYSNTIVKVEILWIDRKCVLLFHQLEPVFFKLQNSFMLIIQQNTQPWLRVS